MTDWTAGYVAGSDWLPPKLGYACSAHYLGHTDALNLSAEQRALMKEIPDPMFRETVRDFCVNQQFRRDYWVKGAHQLTATKQAEAVLATCVLVATARADASLKEAGSLGEATMQGAIYGPILDTLADHQPPTLCEIERAVAGKAVADKANFAQALRAAMVLNGSGSLLAVQDNAVIAQAKPSATSSTRIWSTRRVAAATSASWPAR